MGQVSYLEDIEESRLAALIHEEFARFERLQMDRLANGGVSEETLRREIASLRSSIVAPLETIVKKVGANGPDLGNQLLELQLQINQASAGVSQVIARLGSGSQGHGAGSLAELLESTLENFRLLLRIIHVLSQPLKASEKDMLNQMEVSFENEIGLLRGVPKTLRAREEGVAQLYAENLRLKDELDSLRNPGRSSLDTVADTDWNQVMRDPGMKRLRR